MPQIREEVRSKYNTGTYKYYIGYALKAIIIYMMMINDSANLGVANFH
jgi:hypothetical protein